jgi:hypothetical protein
MLRVAGVVALSACFACGQDVGEADFVGSSSDAASSGSNDEGTKLSVTAGESALECSADGSAADATVSYTVTSTAGADSASLTAIVDGGAEQAIGQIASGSAGWTFDGRIKTASGEATFTLANGEHSIVICATQSGAGGRLPKRACSLAVIVLVDCEIDRVHCNQGVGNGSEGCDPGNSNNHNPSNDEGGGSPGNPGRGR